MRKPALALGAVLTRGGLVMVSKQTSRSQQPRASLPLRSPNTELPFTTKWQPVAKGKLRTSEDHSHRGITPRTRSEIEDYLEASVAGITAMACSSE